MCKSVPGFNVGLGVLGFLFADTTAIRRVCTEDVCTYVRTYFDSKHEFCTLNITAWIYEMRLKVFTF